MKKKKAVSDELYELRHRAEKSRLKIQEKTADITSSEELHRLIHELSIHQIELEMQQEELLQSRADLEESLERYTDLYDFAPIGYLTLARDSSILEVNLTATKMLNINRSLLLGDRLGRFVAFHDLPVFNRLIDDVFRHREQKSAEVILLPSNLKTDDVAMMTVRIDAVVSDDSQECRVILTDLTKQKEVEQQNVVLQFNLIQAQKMESIGRLAGGVAHDFNNMLQVMLGNIDLLIDTEDLKSSVREIFYDLRMAVLKSAGLTSQLLAFARRQPVNVEVLDFNAVVSHTLGMLQRLLGTNVELICKFSKDLWPVQMDSSQIDQIITNIAINARDAIQGIGTISIETRNVSVDAVFCKYHPEIVPGNYVLLSVQDNGSGMDKTTLDSVFEPFFSTKSSITSTGLGLATVHGIVMQNNGVILVSSEIGKGTTFEIYLPCYGGTFSPSSLLKTHEKLCTGHEIILLVEDDKSVRDLTLEFLKGFGYTVLVAASPQEAISLESKYSGNIHLLITDVIMPVMNGRDLALLITEKRPGLKVLFISGYADVSLQGDKDQNVSMPFLGKPFSRTELARKVREVLEV